MRISGSQVILTYYLGLRMSLTFYIEGELMKSDDYYAQIVEIIITLFYTYLITLSSLQSSILHVKPI